MNVFRKYHMFLGQILLILELVNLVAVAAPDGSFETGNVEMGSGNIPFHGRKSLSAPVPEPRFLSRTNPFYWIFFGLWRVTFKKYLKLTRPPKDDGVCYHGVGCFNSSERMGLSISGPEPPEFVNATFYFFNNASSPDLEELLDEHKKTRIPSKTFTVANWTLGAMNNTLNTTKLLLVVTHGLTGSKRTPWMKPLVRELLDNLNCTVLVVDWEKGAAGSWTDAAVNTPMAGVLISQFLQKVINETRYKLDPKNVTLIGFSMGGQVMGFVGRHYRNATNMTLGRIAGLDPAGYLFTDTKSCLSKEDVEYVDVIHTHGGDIFQFKIGVYPPVGHVYFYPNGGIMQAGCQPKPSLFNFMETFTCSHYRAPQLFIESLKYRNCSFISYECDSWEKYEDKTCTKKYNISQIGKMGYYSQTALGRGKQYLYTNKAPPYCRGNTTDRPRK